ncbi:unnamed protein product [Adineta ricciae]|uniref:Uncharacterized protein n=1 Tax=Adineta ricciae TaxID=249248 RepID=A0A816DB01_ADIRI|nr:unnamed protein product [Adineta ricciae]CAF1633941.1 unnamed protein product [Adineta ricciae]
MSTDELEILRRPIGELISINSFFSTTLNLSEALAFLNRSIISSDLHRVLFVIDANPKVVTFKPFADISEFSNYKGEREILFMIECIFLLVDIHLLSLAKVLHNMGRIDLAERMLKRLLSELPSNDPSLQRVYWPRGLVTKDKGDYDDSQEWFNKVLELYIIVSVAMSYNNMGLVYTVIEEHDLAMEHHNRAVKIRLKCLPPQHPDIAMSYKNIGRIHERNGKWLKALVNYEKAAEIYYHSLPAQHSNVIQIN